MGLWFHAEALSMILETLLTRGEHQGSTSGWQMNYAWITCWVHLPQVNIWSCLRVSRPMGHIIYIWQWLTRASGRLRSFSMVAVWDFFYLEISGMNLESLLHGRYAALNHDASQSVQGQLFSLNLQRHSQILVAPHTHTHTLSVCWEYKGCYSWWYSLCSLYWVSTLCIMFLFSR